MYTLESLENRRKSLLRQIEAVNLKLKSPSGALEAYNLKKQLEELKARLRSIDALILKARSQVQVQGGRVAPVRKAVMTSRFDTKQIEVFQPSLPVVVEKPVAKVLPVLPKPVFVDVTPKFEAEPPVEEPLKQVGEQFEIVEEQIEGSDWKAMLMEYKWLILGGAIAGWFFLGKEKKRSNPRKRKSKKGVRKMRRNKRRSGYHRQ